MADTYRGFELEYYAPPIPSRSLDWSAAPVDYDLGDPVLHGATREAVIAEVDRWWEEEAEDYPGIVERASRSGASPSPGEGRPIDTNGPEESTRISCVPWTDAEVENLRRRQAARWLHPYTGPGHVNLIPSNEGWRLPDGTLYQQWAWRSDVEGDIGTDPLEHLRVASPGEGRETEASDGE